MFSSRNRAGRILSAVGLLVLLLFCPLLVQSECPPAEIGKPYSLYCSGHSKRGLYWNVALPSGKVETILPCNHKGTSGCTSLIPPTNVFVSNQRRSPGLYSSQLLITNVTVSQTDQVFICSTLGDANEASQEVSRCRLHVYHKPEVPECSASKAGDNRIRFQCSTRRVFPGLACRATQVELSRNETIDIYKGFQYQTALMPNGSETFFNASCYVEIEGLRNGRYQFVGRLSSARWYDNYQAKLSVSVQPTQPLSISVSPARVTIKTRDPWPISMCHENPSTVTVLCESYGFESRPLFEWYFNGVRENASRFKTEKISNDKTLGKHNYLSTYKFEASETNHGSIIKCEAKSPKFECFDSIRFAAQYPPSEVPEFKDKFLRSVKLSYDITEGEVAQMLCLVKGGEPKVTSVQVVCYKGVERFAFSANKGYMTFFTLNATKNVDNAICSCTAAHVTKCYHSTAILVIRVTASQRSLDDGRDVSFIIYIIIAVVGCMTLIAGIAIIFHFCQETKRRGRYTCEKKRSTPDSRTTHRNFEHVYEVVGSQHLDLRSDSLKSKGRHITSSMCCCCRAPSAKNQPALSHDLSMNVACDDCTRTSLVTFNDDVTRAALSPVPTDIIATAREHGITLTRGCIDSNGIIDEYITPVSVLYSVSGDSGTDCGAEFSYDSGRDCYGDLDLSADFEPTSSFGSGSNRFDLDEEGNNLFSMYTNLKYVNGVGWKGGSDKESKGRRSEEDGTQRERKQSDERGGERDYVNISLLREDSYHEDEDSHQATTDGERDCVNNSETTMRKLSLLRKDSYYEDEDSDNKLSQPTSSDTNSRKNYFDRHPFAIKI